MSRRPARWAGLDIALGFSFGAMSRRPARWAGLDIASVVVALQHLGRAAVTGREFQAAALAEMADMGAS